MAVLADQSEIVWVVVARVSILVAQVKNNRLPLPFRNTALVAFVPVSFGDKNLLDTAIQKFAGKELRLTTNPMMITTAAFHRAETPG